MYLEKEIEGYLVKQVKKISGLCFKFTSPGARGVPDRIVIYGGDVFFAELKRPGGKPRADQIKMMEKFNDQFMPIYVLDTKPKVDEFIQIVLKGYVR